MISSGTFDDIYVGDYFRADYDGTANSGASSSWTWHLRYVDLMSETNVYGIMIPE